MSFSRTCIPLLALNAKIPSSILGLGRFFCFSLLCIKSSLARKSEIIVLLKLNNNYSGMSVDSALVGVECKDPQFNFRLLEYCTMSM